MHVKHLAQNPRHSKPHTTLHSFSRCLLSYFCACPPLRDHPVLQHLFQARNLNHFLKSSSGSPAAYGKSLHGWMNITITSNSASTKFNSSALPCTLAPISTPMSINYNTRLPIMLQSKLLSYPCPSSPISRLSQESLSYFNSIMSLLFPNHAVWFELPGWPLCGPFLPC